ncbi:hypothetical protein KTQ42_20185 [Noviherbaspirillum sp. L7-7A]|uniref:hypothetical protein n=1 Tax=Noviherbaspirillum sp. L7-7A TaxID=2850560 RepID=UPI001C2BF55B|nr:hypothetical protein [Noviherbaspirillum sp. L7-7A]MBV0881603.1 hypothetical protein [Noviherbaspirillum sp. L7-7A]
MSDQVIYLSMVDIVKRVIRVQTNAERLMKPTVSEQEMLDMLLEIETSAAWLREKFSTMLTEEERTAYANFRREHGSD